jgi:hypothetical protein
VEGFVNEDFKKVRLLFFLVPSIGGKQCDGLVDPHISNPVFPINMKWEIKRSLYYFELPSIRFHV